MGAADSVANFVDRMRADIAQQNYWNSQAALNSLQNQSTSDPEVVRRIQEETAAQQEAAMKYAQMIEQQGQRERGGPTVRAATIEQLMGERGGTPLRPVTREMPDLSKGDYGAPLSEEEKIQYGTSAPPKVVSRKQFATEEAWQNWLREKQGQSAPKDDASLIGPPQGEPMYGAEAPEAKVRPAQAAPQSDFEQASNRGGKRALDVTDMGFGESPQKSPAEILRELETTGHPLDAQDFRYRLEQRDRTENLRRLQEAMSRTDEESAKKLRETWLPLIEAQAHTKPIDDNIVLKDAREELYNSESRKTYAVLGNLRNELIQGQKMLDAKQVDKAITFFKANVPKVLNFLSTYSPDALQDPEVKRLMPELQTYLDAGLSPFELAKKVQETGLLKSFSRDPKAFLEKSQALYNAAAKAQNARFDKIKSRIGNVASGLLQVDKEKFELFGQQIAPGIQSRSSAMERGAAAPTMAPAGAVRKSVSPAAVYPQ